MTETAMGWRLLTPEERRWQPFVDWAFRLAVRREWPFEDVDLRIFSPYTREAGQ